MSVNINSLAMFAESSRSAIATVQLRAPQQHYCAFCDKQMFSQPMRLRSPEGIKLYRVCLGCSEIICSVPAPRLVGIEPNPGPPRRTNQRRRTGRARTNGVRSMNNLYTPPPHQSNIRLNHKFRFMALATELSTITSQNVLGALGTLGTITNTAVGTCAESFRIKKLSIWSPPASQGAATTISVEWIGTQQSPSIEVSDSSNSVSRPAHISSAPPKNSNAAFWHTPQIGNENLFNLSLFANSIVDLDVEYILLDDAANKVSLAVTTAVIGNPYYLALDGPTNNNIVPLSLSTTH